VNDWLQQSRLLLFFNGTIDAAFHDLLLQTLDGPAVSRVSLTGLIFQ